MTEHESRNTCLLQKQHKTAGKKKSYRHLKKKEKKKKVLNLINLICQIIFKYVFTDSQVKDLYITIPHDMTD